MVITGGDIASIITAIALLLTAIGSIGGLVMSIRNGHSIQEVHKTTNSKMDAMLELATKAARAEGKEAGRVEREASDASELKGRSQAVVTADIEGNVAEKRLADAAEKITPAGPVKPS